MRSRGRVWAPWSTSRRRGVRLPYPPVQAHSGADPGAHRRGSDQVRRLASEFKGKGAPTGQPIDGYRQYARAYSGTGPAAAYADRVIADAHAYQGVGTLIVAGCTVAASRRYRPRMRRDE